MSAPKSNLTEFTSDVVFKSPSEKKKKKNKNKTPTAVVFPCQISLAVTELRLFQQSSISFVAVNCSLSVDDEVKTFESDNSEFNNRNNSTEFKFDILNSSGLFTVDQEWKRIVAKINITTSASSFIPAFGVANVPMLNTLQVPGTSESLPPLSMPIMNGHTKIGEMKIQVEKYNEVLYNEV